jgi:hypothetical protein
MKVQHEWTDCPELDSNNTKSQTCTAGIPCSPWK